MAKTSTSTNDPTVEDHPIHSKTPLSYEESGNSGRIGTNYGTRGTSGNYGDVEVNVGEGSSWSDNRTSMSTGRGKKAED